MNTVAIALWSFTLSGVTIMAIYGQGEPPLYHPPGMWAWDFWFAKDRGTYHAFHLQAAQCLGAPALMHGNQHVGHATSTDLLHWTNHGPVLVPVHGTWNDICIATGSIAKNDGRWWMLFTGVGNKQAGIGLAVSDDLMTWKKTGDGPVVSLGVPFEATWQGKAIQWRGCADPYVYPEPIDGWYYMILNSQVVEAPVSLSGCLTTIRSRDMKAWEPAGVLTWPKWFERLETPQLWKHENRWYLYFGGAHDHGIPDKFRGEVPEEVVKLGIRVNCVFTSDTFEGPYKPTGKWWFTLPDGKWGYIAKVIRDPQGTDVLLMATDNKLSRPYPATYGPEGSLALGMPKSFTP